MAVGDPKLLFRGSFDAGVVRDTGRYAIPANGVYDARDFLLHRPGIAEKRGGWRRHSALVAQTYFSWLPEQPFSLADQISADGRVWTVSAPPEGGSTAAIEPNWASVTVVGNTISDGDLTWELVGDAGGLSVAAVGTIHIPTRVVAVGDDNNAYDVTSEASPQADIIGACYTPAENPPLYVDRLIFTDPTSANPPKKVYYDTGMSAMTVADLGGTPPAAGRSIVHASRIVLGRGTLADGTLQRAWFAPLPDVEATWDTTNSYLDFSNELIGFASCSGVLLGFSPIAIERVLGGVPPGVTGENMELQPLAGVGCLDARSIVHLDQSVVFAGQEGVWITNGAGVQSLTQGRVQTYWESLFEPAEIRQIVGGLLTRQFYLLSVLGDNNTGVETLLCHLPSRTWMRVNNIAARMFAQGRDEQENLELYMAAAAEGYVEKLSSILRPTWANRSDGDGTAVEPLIEVTYGDAGVLKEFLQGRVSATMTFESTDLWSAETVYVEGSQVAAAGQVFQVSAVTDDATSGTDEPDWATAPDVGDTVVDNNVTWTNMGPQLVVSVAQGVTPGSFTDALTVYADADGRSRRNVFPRMYSAPTQAQTVRLTQVGASSTTEVHGIELDVVQKPAQLEGE